ncbi:MAG: lipid carrier [Ancalomicrobiaceae bacterium]|nr:lipid carrier [Ancalomicrobiaceae bacterium]
MTDHQPKGLPAPLRFLAKPLPLLPVGTILSLAVRRLAARRPGVFDRIGPYRTCRFRIAPVDLDFDFLLVPDGTRARVDTIPRRARVASDVEIGGPLVDLLGLLDGTLDGDALFFTRTITVRGRTDAVVALRNAIEDAELKPADLLGLTGRLGTTADAVILKAIALLRRLATEPSGRESADPPGGSSPSITPFGSRS